MRTLQLSIFMILCTICLADNHHDIVSSTVVSTDEIKALKEWTPAAVVSDEAVKDYGIDS